MSTDTLEVRKVKLKEAPKYCNVFYNNETTDVDLVVFILTKIFKLSRQDAEQKTHEIHTNKQGIVYINSKEICDFKKDLVDEFLTKASEHDLVHSVKIYGDD